MPEFHLADSIITSLNAQEPWPDNVKLYQPYEVEQILLPDNASCLAVQAFLKMSNLPFEVEMRWNAEFMSPSGRVPFIKCGAFVVSELEPIVQFAANKGVTLCTKLSTEEKAEMRAYMSLITNVLVNAELYISWLDNDTYNAVTKVRNSSVYPWPLGWLQTRSKRNAVAKRLKALHWHDKTLDQVLADVEQCCNSLSQRLGDRDFFFGNTPTALDALVFGHVRALLSANGPKAAFMIRPITTPLLRHTVNMVGVTGMILQVQEDYLIRQAFLVTGRRLAPEPIYERNTRVKKSKLCLSNRNVNNVTYNRDTFGFKPFASKQIIIMSSNEGVTCTYDDGNNPPISKVSDTNFAFEIVETILEKVEETAFVEDNKIIERIRDHDFVKDDKIIERIEHHDCEKDNKIIERIEDHDFEMVYPNQNDGDAKFGSVIVKINEFLDTIEENADSIEAVDTADSVDQRSIDTSEIFQIIHDEDTDLVEDSDGMVNDKHLGSDSQVCSDNNICVDSSEISEVTESISKNDEITANTGSFSTTITLASSDDEIKSSLKFDENDEENSPDSIGSSDSKGTIKMPSDEEISVESLLKYLRERNAAYSKNVVVADVD